jgi:hypothetical protein
VFKKMKYLVLLMLLSGCKTNPPPTYHSQIMINGVVVDCYGIVWHTYGTDLTGCIVGTHEGTIHQATDYIIMEEQ